MRVGGHGFTSNHWYNMEADTPPMASGIHLGRRTSTWTDGGCLETSRSGPSEQRVFANAGLSSQLYGEGARPFDHFRDVDVDDLSINHRS